MPRKAISAEALIDLHRRLATLAPHSPERRQVIQDTAALCGVFEQTLYRALAALKACSCGAWFYEYLSFSVCIESEESNSYVLDLIKRCLGVAIFVIS